MKAFPILLFVLTLSLNASSQQALTDSGFTNKAEAKNEMVNGLKEGKWLEHLNGSSEPTKDTSSSFYVLIVYKTGKPYGLSRKYMGGGKWRDALISITPYVNGQKNGIEKNLHNNNGKLASEIPYADGKINGLAIGYFSNGKQSYETEFTNGIKNGLDKQYTISGVPKTETTYENGTKKLEKEYYPSGKLKRVTPFRGELEHGTSKEYYENDTLKSTTDYIDGSKYNLMTEYYENGKMKRETYYTDDTIQTIQTEFYDTGILKSETEYQGGVAWEITTYNEKGEAIETKELGKKD